jgi:hypothetical protein
VNEVQFLLLLSAPDHFDRWAALTPDQLEAMVSVEVRPARGVEIR